MPKKIAIDWDASELRLVVGRTSSTGVTVSDVAVIPLAADDDQAFAETLRKTLDERGLAKLPMLVTMGRGKAELRQLQLPPVPEEELPDMIRFQAIRDFAAAGERAIIDFVHGDSTVDGIQVVAAAVTPEQVASIHKLAGDGQAAAERIALRPLAAAALYAKHQPSEEEVVLVDLLADDADIVILRAGKRFFVRSVRLPNSDTGRPVALAGEVRRSIMASRGNATSESARKIVIWGRKDIHASDIQQLSERIGLSVETLDPLSLVSVDAAVKASAPEHVGRLAPLIGLLDVDESGSPLLIDFQNPRQRPEVQSQRGRYLLYGIAAAAVLVLVGFSAWSSLRTRDQQIADLQKQLADLKPVVAASQVVIDRADRVDTFLDGNVVWLEEIKRVAENLPPAEQLILTSVDANLPQRSGAELTLAGKVSESKVVDTMRSRLQDEQHRAIRQGASEAPGSDRYGWEFNDMKIVIEPEVVRAMRDTKRYLAKSGAPVATAESTPTPSTPDPSLKPKPADEEAPIEAEPVAAPEMADTAEVVAVDDEPIDAAVVEASAPEMKPEPAAESTAQEVEEEVSPDDATTKEAVQ